MSLSRHLFRAVVGVALTAVAAASQAVVLVGLTSSNEIARIDTANLAGATRTSITGLAAGDRFVGIDSRPKDGLIYGITLSSQVYTVNATTGAASLVAALGTPGLINAALGYGIDFNPVADFGTGASLRLVSSAGNNYAINASTGAVTVGTSIATGFTGVAYSNASFFPSAAPASTSLYYIDSNADTLSVATSAFNAPTEEAISALVARRRRSLV